MQFLKSARALSAKQLRWTLFLNDYDFVITYRPGKENAKADALSRINDFDDKISIQQDTPIIAPEKILGLTRNFNLIQLLQEIDKDSIPKEIKKDLLFKEGLWYKEDNICLPTEETQKEALRLCHGHLLAGHPGPQKTLSLNERQFWWPTMSND